MKKSALTLPMLLLLAVMMIGIRADYAKAEVTTGDCGATEKTVSWTYDDETDVLTISGTGAIKDYSDTDTSGFRRYRASAKTIYMESGITAIGKFAFYEFSAAKTFVFPDTIESYGEDSFTGCNKPKFLGPSDLEVIQKYAYYHNITYAEGGACGADGANVLWEVRDEYGCMCIYGTGAMKDYKNGQSEDFRIKKLTENYVIIGDGVTRIGDYAFANFSELLIVEIGDTVESIGTDAFSMCGKLNYIAIPEQVTEISERVFYGCMYLDTLDAPNVTRIGNGAFYGCARLKHLNTAPITYIDDSGLRECKILDKLVLPDKLEYIGKYALDDCDHLVLYVNANTVGHQYAVDNNISYNLLKGEIEAKEGQISYEFDTETSTLKITGNGAMKDYETISDSPFYGFGNEIKAVEIGEGISYIGSYSFGNNYGISSVTMADTVTEIGERAFYNAYNLESIELSDNLTTVGAYAFCGCEKLGKVQLGNKLTSIGRWSFYGCSDLIIYTSEGSVADVYAKENGISVSHEGMTADTTETEEKTSTEATASPAATGSPSTSASSSASTTTTSDSASNSLLKPAKILIKSLKNKAKKSVLVKWKKASGVEGYQVQYSLKRSFKKKASKTTKALKLRVKKLKKKKTYFFRVRAYKTVNGTRVYGAWSAKKKVKIKK